MLFFEALSSQPEPFIPPKVEPLTDAERAMARSLFTSPAAPCLKCHMTGNAEHDKNASAPNFLLAHERLQPAWTGRWITDPAKIIPGTAMPSGLFRREDGPLGVRRAGSGVVAAVSRRSGGSAGALHVHARRRRSRARSWVARQPGGSKAVRRQVE